MSSSNNGYYIDFGKEIQQTYKKQTGVVPYFLEHGDSIIRYLFTDYCAECHFGHRHYNRSISMLKRLLAPTGEYELFQIMLNAFIYSEARFIANYIPQKSHEERLTGHLLSEYSASLNIIKQLFEKRSSEIYDEQLELEFYYADLSTGNAEKITGADFGIMVHLDLPDSPEKVIAATFQAKKLTDNVRIDVAQLKALINHFPNGSNYCLYDMNTINTNSPLVISAKNLFEKTKRENNGDGLLEFNKSFSIGKDSLIGNYQCIPLSFSLIETMVAPDRANAAFHVFKDVWEAQNFFLEPSESKQRNSAARVDKTLLVSIRGRGRMNNDLSSLSRLFG